MKVAEVRPEPLFMPLHLPEERNERGPVWKKVLSCIPYIGYAASYLFEGVVDEQLKFADRKNDPIRFIELITLKNEYKKCRITCGVLCLITYVAYVALGLFPMANAVVGSLIVLFIMGVDIYQIYMSNLDLNKLEQHHLRQIIHN